MSSIPTINKEALAHYRKVRDFNKRYSAIEESTHTEFLDDDASCISTSTRSTNGSADWLMDSPTMSPMRPRGRKRLSKYHGEHNMKSLKEKSPSSVDRSLRNQEWLGSPVSVGKARRSWRPKNPEDMAGLYMPTTDEE